MFNPEPMSREYYLLLGGEPSKFPEDTPNRLEQFFIELERKRNYEKFTTFESHLDEMIVINGLKVFSFCEHHLLPFFGFCSIGYIPDGKILGLSKFQRIVDKVSSHPTLQENITSAISHKVEEILKPKGSGVAVTCVHTCMYGRGINTSTCTVNSQALVGKLRTEGTTRDEFLARIKVENILR